MKRALLTLTLSLAVAFTAFAQTNNATNSAANSNTDLERIVHANATIIANFEVFVTSHVNFGQISGAANGGTAADAVLNPNGGSSTEDNIDATDGTPGGITIVENSSTNGNFTVSWTDGTLALSSDQTKTMTFTPEVTFANNAAGDNWAAVTDAAADNVTADSGNDILLSIGGTLAVGDDTPAGDYSTESTGGSPVTFTFDHSDF